MLHESPALRDLRVTFHVPVFVACGTLPSRDRRACARVCHPASRVAIHASTTLAMRWPLPSLADDLPPHVCGLSPLRVVNDPTGHVPARLPRVTSTDPLWPRWHPLAAYSTRAGECPRCCGIVELATRTHSAPLTDMPFLRRRRRARTATQVVHEACGGSTSGGGTLCCAAPPSDVGRAGVARHQCGAILQRHRGQCESVLPEHEPPRLLHPVGAETHRRSV